MGTADHVTLLPGHSVSSDGQYNQPVFHGFNGTSNTLFISTEEPRNSAFQGTRGFHGLLREMLYCHYIELKEKAFRD